MNIWIINQYASPLSGAGGTRHAAIARYLARMGHQTTIFVSHPNDLNIRFDTGKVFNDIKFEGYTFRYVKSPKYKNVVERFISMLVFRRNVIIAAKGLVKPDIVIGSTVHLHGADAGRILANKFNALFVFEIRDIWPQTLVDIGSLNKANPVYWYLKFMEIRLLRSAKKIISVLPGANAYLVKNGVEKESIFYLPNGVDTDLYPEGNIAPHSNGNFVAMFFGAHGPANCLETLINAAKILKDRKILNIKIVLIGEGVSKSNLIQMSSQLNLSNVKFMDIMPKRELFIKAAEADCYIFNLKDMKVLELYGISSNKLFDYLMCKRPIVFSCRSFNNPVEEADAGITVDPENPLQLAEALILLSKKERTELQRMGNNGHSWVLKNHSYEKLTQKLEIMLKSL